MIPGVAEREAFEAYLRDLAGDRRRAPGADLISQLAAVVETGGDRLTEDELIGTAVLLLNAGIVPPSPGPRPAANRPGAHPDRDRGAAQV